MISILFRFFYNLSGKTAERSSFQTAAYTWETSFFSNLSAARKELTLKVGRLILFNTVTKLTFIFEHFHYVSSLLVSFVTAIIERTRESKLIIIQDLHIRTTKQNRLTQLWGIWKLDVQIKISTFQLSDTWLRIISE